MTARQPAVPALMLQGTSSDAGKSLLTCALGRIFRQDGYAPVPFKAQNMSSYSREISGGLISGAQALQALACGLEPDPRMNPVLLRPVSDLGSEVIVLGKTRGIMRAREYQALKSELWGEVSAAYASLLADSGEKGVMLLEGAGSPAEINLKEHDIVNMRMAREAGAAVLVVGDIDRGGVFAHLYGTFALLEAEEQALIKGFVLNKFRGDASLLEPALRETAARTGVPFCGTVPYLPALGLPEEDSLSGKESRWPEEAELDAALNVLAAHVRGSLDMEYIYGLLKR